MISYLSINKCKKYRILRSDLLFKIHIEIILKNFNTKLINVLQKMNSTLESLKNEVDFVINSNETYENQLQIETINKLYSEVSLFSFCIIIYLKKNCYFNGEYYLAVMTFIA